MIKADCHVHSEFSGDCDVKMENMIEKAISLGLTHLCFTDHLDYNFPEEYGLFFEFDIDKYVKKLEELKHKYKSDITILTGVELGLMPHLAETYSKLIKQYEFDFVIGSSHLVDRMDPYYPKYWERLENVSSETEKKALEREGYIKYFQTIIDNTKAFKDYNVYGHIDYIVRYGPFKNQNYNYRDYSDILDEVLKTILNADKAVEVNTAGFKYGLNNMHPHKDVLKRYKELGGEIITLGSDAHKTEHLAFEFSKTCDILKELGFKYYAVYKQQKPEFYKL